MDRRLSAPADSAGANPEKRSARRTFQQPARTHPRGRMDRAGVLVGPPHGTQMAEESKTVTKWRVDGDWRGSFSTYERALRRGFRQLARSPSGETSLCSKSWAERKKPPWPSSRPGNPAPAGSAGNNP